MAYPQELIDEIVSKNDIVDIIGQHVELKGRGDDLSGLCPFHNEKTPSFHVTRSKQLYYCFGCHAGGNLITFLEEYEKYSFLEAIRYLAERAHITLPVQEESAEQKRERGERQRLFEINREAATFFYHQLRMEAGAVGRRYFTERQLSEETMQRFGLGYALQYKDALVRYLRSKGYEDRLIIAAGLASYYERDGMTDKFFNRVMFPIMDLGGKVIGFGGRVMGEGKPKYLNSPETKIFEKRKNLYGLNYARANRKGRFILCEGYMDVIALHQAGFTEAVASLGTAFTMEQALLLKRYTKEVLLAYDSDGAGVNAALKALELLQAAGMRGRVIDARPHKDPDEFIKALGAEAYEERIRKAENGFLYEIRMLRSAYDTSDPAQKTEFETETARRLTRFEDELERENYLHTIAESYGISPEGLRKAVIRQAAAAGYTRELPKSYEPRERRGTEDVAQERSRYRQRVLLTWLVEEPQRFPLIAEYVSCEDFTDPLYRAVAEQIYEGLQKGGLQPAAIISRFEDEEEQRRAAEVFHTRLDAVVTEEEREKALRDIVIGIKEEGLSRLRMDQVIEAQKVLERLKAADRIGG